MCNVFSLHKQFNPDRIEDIAEQCRGATRGCVDCKKMLAEGINGSLEEFRERRRELAERPEYLGKSWRTGRGGRASLLGRP